MLGNSYHIRFAVPRNFKMKLRKTENKKLTKEFNKTAFENLCVAHNVPVSAIMKKKTENEINSLQSID